MINCKICFCFKSPVGVISPLALSIKTSQGIPFRNKTAFSQKRFSLAVQITIKLPFAFYSFDNFTRLVFL